MYFMTSPSKHLAGMWLLSVLVPGSFWMFWNLKRHMTGLGNDVCEDHRQLVNTVFKHTTRHYIWSSRVWQHEGSRGVQPRWRGAATLGFCQTEHRICWIPQLGGHSCCQREMLSPFWSVNALIPSCPGLVELFNMMFPPLSMFGFSSFYTPLEDSTIRPDSDRTGYGHSSFGALRVLGVQNEGNVVRQVGVINTIISHL